MQCTLQNPYTPPTRRMAVLTFCKVKLLAAVIRMEMTVFIFSSVVGGGGGGGHA